MKPDVLYQTAKKKILDALPDILFFLFLFYAILVLFGVQYVIVVSFVTLLHKLRRQRKQSPRRLLTMFLVQMLLSILAFLACHSLIACIILNIYCTVSARFSAILSIQPKGIHDKCHGFCFSAAPSGALCRFSYLSFGYGILAGLCYLLFTDRLLRSSKAG